MKQETYDIYRVTHRKTIRRSISQVVRVNGESLLSTSICGVMHKFPSILVNFLCGLKLLRKGI